MSTHIYNQIQELHNYSNNVERGRKFEVLVREILPWDKRPPIVLSPKTEQLDGVFVYLNTVYIIECKAKKGTITAGSSDWEDYELKLRRRKQNVVGIFCSLGKVSKEVVNRAKSLINEGFLNFIITGDDWLCLQQKSVDFKVLIDFMRLSVRVLFEPQINVEKLIKWHYDKEQISSYFSNIGQKHSAFFLRRNKHQYHEQIYVERGIEKQISNYINSLKPQSLKNKINRETTQVLILSDSSGAGKTTFSINKTLNYNYSFSCAAENEELDKYFDSFLNKIEYPDFGIRELEAVNTPLLFLVDSLDEVSENRRHYKYKEIKSLLTLLEQLNNKARELNFSAFPILIIFTIREDYIRDWEAVFEGRREKQIIEDKISLFTDGEFEIALSNYFNTYDYKITNELSEEAKGVLSIPVNLEIFSEACRYEGDIIVEDIWEGKILENYFTKKQEFIYKHQIHSFTKSVFMDLISELSYFLIINKNRSFSKHNFYNIISKKYSAIETLQEQILDLYVSEQIISKNNGNIYYFRYNRFIEYLVAYKIIRFIENKGEITSIDSFIIDILNSTFLSAHSVLKNIKYIAETLFPTIGKDIYEYYSKTNIYLQSRLPSLRYEIANGKKTDNEDIHNIISNTYTQDKEIVWDMFFIIAAKNNKQSIDDILEAFSIAWDGNSSFKERRWKILQKLRSLDLLIQEKVLFKLLKDSIAKDWETYLGSIIEDGLRDSFLNLWDQVGCAEVMEKIICRDKHNFRLTDQLLSIIITGKDYIPGDVFYEIKDPNEYVVFKEKEQKSHNISNHSKEIIDKLVTELRNCITNEKTEISTLRLWELTSQDQLYLKDCLVDLNEKGYDKDSKPFINYILSKNSTYRTLMNTLSWKREYFDFDVTLTDKNNTTCFQDIINSEIDNTDSVFEYFEYIFLQGYQKNKFDDTYLKNQKNATFILPSIQNNALVGRLYYQLNNIEHIKLLRHQSRILFTFLSIYHKRPIGFAFSNLIQVVNNALEHYSNFGELTIKALDINGLLEEYKTKKSFNSKVTKLRNNNISQNIEFNEVLMELFPDLF